VRTTIDLDEDILRVAKDLARDKEQSLGRVVSDLVRRGLKPPVSRFKTRNGVPLLMPEPGDPPITSELVRELLERDE
jgi:hypothetical protein